MQRFLNWAMPDFLGIGAQRAGTTWLWKHLRGHPQIWTPRTKELHFFDRRVRRRRLPWIGRRREAQVRYALNFVVGRLLGKHVGEVTPAYAILPEDRVRIIAAWMPDVRVVYLVRDPVQRAWSQAAKSYRKWAGHPLVQAKEESLRVFFRLPEVMERGNYLAALRTWRSHLPADQIFVCASEEMFARPVDTLRRIFVFLGVDPDISLDPAELERPIHKGSVTPIPESVRGELEAMLYPQREELESMLGITLPWGR
ncbi:MAG TPA: sulfotransferase [bacterium]|jgi:hypothetical protein|nr:sulfotransferase [bacterium]